MENVPSKRCKICGYLKPLEDFSRDKTVKDGRRIRCKECVSRSRGHIPHEHVPEGYIRCSHCHRVLPATFDNFLHHSRHKNGFNTLCKICHNKANVEYYAKHPDKKYQVSARYYNKTKVERKVQARDWRRSHPELARAIGRSIVQRRRNRKRGLPVGFTIDDWQFCKSYWHNACAYCGRSNVELCQDHFIPQSPAYNLTIPNPGYVVANIVLACRSCNAKKRNQNPYVWIPLCFGEEQSKNVISRIETYFTIVATR